MKYIFLCCISNTWYIINSINKQKIMLENGSRKNNYGRFPNKGKPIHFHRRAIWNISNT